MALIKSCVKCGKIFSGAPYWQHKWISITCNRCLGMRPGIPSNPLDPAFNKYHPRTSVPSIPNKSILTMLKESVNQTIH